MDDDLRTENHVEENKAPPNSPKIRLTEVKPQENKDLKNKKEKESSDLEQSAYQDTITDWDRKEYSNEIFEQIKEEKFEEKLKETARIKKRKIIKSDSKKRDIQAQQIKDETKKKVEVSLETGKRERGMKIKEKRKLHSASDTDAPL